MLVTIYVVSSVLFVVGLLGYWIVTHSFRNVPAIYEAVEPQIANQ